MEFGVLGTIRVVADDGREIALPSRMVRRLLAVLICHVNRPVSAEILIDELWGTPPASARDNLRKYVSYLRKALGDDRVRRDRYGYQLVIHAGEMDGERFETLAAEAADVIPHGDLELSEKRLGEALALWRGAAFADMPDLPTVRQEAVRLEETRLTAVEHRNDVRMQRGRHRELVAELAALVADQPLRERLRGQLMLALYRSGRKADALDAYRHGYRLLAEELGLEPGEELRRLERAILSDDPELMYPQSTGAVVTGAPVPAELPMGMTAFTGRTDEARLLRGVLSATRPNPVVITGSSGVGKSALAIHVGRRLADQYPDGQIYVNLHGATPNVEPLSASDALGHMLRSLGAHGRSIPSDVDEAAGRFRSLCEGKRLLIVLDNVHDAAQVRPLVAANPACGVVLTSRRTLVGLVNADHVRLDVMSATEATELLSNLIGAERVEKEPEAAAELVARCGKLPLALVITAARLRVHPTWSIQKVADRLEGEARRFSELEADDSGVRASFAISYGELDAEARGMFQLISLLDSADIGTHTAAALADVDHEKAEEVLDELTEMHLVGNPEPGRYTLHDLMRLFARERAEDELPADTRDDAIHRALHCYLATARSALLLISPPAAWLTEIEPHVLRHAGMDLADRDAAFAWVGEEVGNLTDIVRQAATVESDLAIGLAAAFDIPLVFRGNRKTHFALGRISVEVADRTNRPLHQAIAHDVLGDANSEVGDLDEALHHLQLARSAYQKAGHESSAARMLEAMARACRRSGRVHDAITFSKEALELNRQIGEFATARNLMGLGLAYQNLGRLSEAIAAHSESLAIFEAIGRIKSSTLALANLGEAHRLDGDPRAAIDFFRRAQVTSRRSEAIETYVDAEIWWSMGRAHHDLGQPEEARKCWRRSAAVLRDLNLISADEKSAIDHSDRPATPEVILRNL